MNAPAQNDPAFDKITAATLHLLQITAGPWIAMWKQKLPSGKAMDGPLTAACQRLLPSRSGSFTSQQASTLEILAAGMEEHAADLYPEEKKIYSYLTASWLAFTREILGIVQAGMRKNKNHQDILHLCREAAITYCRLCRDFIAGECRRIQRPYDRSETKMKTNINENQP